MNKPRNGSVKVLQFELNRSQFWVCAAKKSGMPTETTQEARKWIAENPDFTANKVWRGSRK